MTQSTSAESAPETTPTTDEAPVTGLHGPECRCTGDEDTDLDTLAGLITKAIVDAARTAQGRTPAETRTSVSDAEAAILNELDSLAQTAKRYGGIMVRAGAAAALADGGDLKAAEVALAEALQARAESQRFQRSQALIRTWLPRVRGVRAVDGEGVGLWLKPQDGTGWLVYAASEKPGPEFVELYVR